MATLVVYAVHDFQAENPDELTFFAGEKVIVLEKDELYGDGWWQGKNPRGEVGLFPQSYTSETPPTEEEMREPLPGTTTTTAAPAPTSATTQASNGVTAAAPTAAAAATPATTSTSASAPQPATAASRDSIDDDGDSLRPPSISSRASDVEDDSNMPVVANPRALLAQKAAENAERDAREQREKEERRRKADEEAYERAKRDAGLEDLQLSDESDEEGEKPLSRSDTPSASRAVPSESTIPALAVTSASANPLASSVSTVRPQQDDLVPLNEASAPSEADKAAPVISTAATPVAVPVPDSATMSNGAPTASLTTSEAADEPIEPKTTSFPVAETLAAAGIGGAAAAGIAHLTGKKEEPAIAQDSSPARAEIAPNSLRSRADPPAPIDTARSSVTSASMHTPPSTLPTSSLASEGTATTSTPVTGNLEQELPFDASTWSVDQVVTWAKMKGFDPLTISKFQEHEISGDVLLEMDIAMLKEIDLVAFGKRVHIYNAIKELKARLSRLSYAGTEASSEVPTRPGSPSGRSLHQRSGEALSPTQASGFGFASQQSSRPSNSRRLSGGSMRSVGHRQSSSVSQAIPESEELDPLTEAENRRDRANIFPVGKSPRLGSDADRLASLSPRLSSSAASIKSNKSSRSNRSDSKKNKSERSFFTVTGIGRSRKPAPSVPSSLLSSSTRSDTSATSTVPTSQARSRMSTGSNSAKRSTRLFSAFSTSSADKSPSLYEGPRSPKVVQTASSRQTSNSSMMPKEVDAVTDEMKTTKVGPVTGGNLLQKIGTPDYSGWMRKRGEKYSTWKPRFFVLKGNHLYYLKSESEQRAKGFVDLSNYRVFADSSIRPGEFGFKLEPKREGDRPHYFAAAEEVTIKNWMKEIMKSTIRRDYSAAALSSTSIDTVPLVVARAMKPRPPSPTSRARAQRERYAGSNPNTLTPKDAAILMEFAPGSDGAAPTPRPGAPMLAKRASSVYSAGSPVFEKSPDRPRANASKRMSTGPGVKGNGSPAGDKRPGQPRSPVTSSSPRLAGSPAMAAAAAPAAVVAPVAAATTSSSTTDKALVEWVNSNLPANVNKVSDLGGSLRSGRVLVRLAESVSKTLSGIPDTDFDKWHAPASNAPGQEGAFDPDYFDVVFAVFDYLTSLVSTEDVSMEDMLSGNEERLSVLVERLKSAYPK